MNIRIQTKGPKTGLCNICGVYGPLTEDHIPPKGVCRLGQMQLMNIVDLLSAEPPKKSTRSFQNGVKYRTLCAKCNGNLLGARYDPALIDLAKNLTDCLDSRIHLPAKLDFLCKPNRLVRSVVGHILAHGVDEHRNGEMIEKLTDYFLCEQQAFPSDIRLYSWIYPYSDQLVVKVAALCPDIGRGSSVFMLLKFFPFSFLFVLDEPEEWLLPLSRLDILLSKNIDDEASIQFNFQNTPPRRWPESPGNSGMVMYGEGATAARPTSKYLILNS